MKHLAAVAVAAATVMASAIAGRRAAAGLARAYRDGLLSRAAGQAAVARIAALRSSVR